jgi:hypothetical protein
MYYTFIWQVLDFAVEFTGLSKLHINGGPKNHSAEPFQDLHLLCHYVYLFFITTSLLSPPHLHEKAKYYDYFSNTASKISISFIIIFISFSYTF